jgi:hypothetical protein
VVKLFHRLQPEKIMAVSSEKKKYFDLKTIQETIKELKNVKGKNRYKAPFPDSSVRILITS